MSDANDQVPQADQEAPLASERAGQIAEQLARIADLARDPRAMTHLPALLEMLIAPADELAEALAASEEGAEDAGQVQEDGAVLVTPAVLALQLAASLTRLAKLARLPRTANRMPIFARCLAMARADAGELAAVLVQSEETDEEIGELRDDEPGRAVPAPASKAPLTFGALDRAMELLTRDAQSRLWPEQEAGELRGLVVEALETAKDATKALRQFLEAQAIAAKMRGRLVVDQQGQPTREPAELQFAYHAVQAALTLVETFSGRGAHEGREPLARVVSALANVQRGTPDPLFEPLKKYTGRRQLDAAHAIGIAAAAMDAWQCAGVARPDAAKRVALLFGGVRRHGGSSVMAGIDHGTVPGIEPKTVAWWRDKAKAKSLTPEEAQIRWDSYSKRRDARHAAYADRHADREWHKVHAAALEDQIAAILANHGPGFTLLGKGREPDPKSVRQKGEKGKIRASIFFRSNRSHG